MDVLFLLLISFKSPAILSFKILGLGFVSMSYVTETIISLHN